MMKVAGIDPAGSGYSGLALVKDKRLITSTVWKPPDARHSTPDQLLQFYRWLYFKLGFWKPDVVAIEELAVFQNKKTIRSLAQREGVALLVAKQKAPIVVSITARTARSIALGDGGLDKDAALKAIREMHPDHKFRAKNKGGLDESDAGTQALAAEDFLEQRKR